MTRFRLRSAMVPEDDIHAAVAKALDLLLLPPAQWTTFPAGGYKLPPAAAARLARIGLKKNWPDVLVVHGSVYGIELKRADGRLSRARVVRRKNGSLRMVEGQEDVFPRLRAAGMKIEVCRSVDEVLAALRKWDVPLRTIT